jgi:hypothetical protein
MNGYFEISKIGALALGRAKKASSSYIFLADL